MQFITTPNSLVFFFFFFNIILHNCHLTSYYNFSIFPLACSTAAEVPSSSPPNKSPVLQNHLGFWSFPANAISWPPQLGVICKFNKLGFYSIIWAAAENIEQQQTQKDPHDSFFVHPPMYMMLQSTAALACTGALACSVVSVPVQNHYSGAWVLFIINLIFIYALKILQRCSCFHLTVFKA